MCSRWSNTVARSKRCVRVREGGGAVLQAIDLDRGCFSCTLGGTDSRTLFLVVAEWRGMADPRVARARTGQTLTVGRPHLVSGGRRA